MRTICVWSILPFKIREPPLAVGKTIAIIGAALAFGEIDTWLEGTVELTGFRLSQTET